MTKHPPTTLYGTGNTQNYNDKDGDVFLPEGGFLGLFLCGEGESRVCEGGSLVQVVHIHNLQNTNAIFSPPLLKYNISLKNLKALLVQFLTAFTSFNFPLEEPC
jgi:hypothetical protein